MFFGISREKGVFILDENDGSGTDEVGQNDRTNIGAMEVRPVLGLMAK